MPGDDKTMLMAPPGRVAVGTQISGTYELDERIAAGGMGEVFRGHNIQTGDPVAIKIVLPEFARDAMILALFRKEASILNHLFHEAIVRYHVFAIDQALERPYLAMEFVDGLPLADMFEQGPMEPKDARALLARLASGLAAAHEAGIIHRDLSPDNIILPGGKVGRAKIIDFGIARSATVGGETLLGGVFAGKYNFVSPEQLGMFGGVVTEKSDIYSLGLVMAAALRGEPLDMSGSQVEVIEKRRTLPDLSAIDSSLRLLLELMLQPDPENRPHSMSEIVDWVGGGTTRPPREPTLTGEQLPPVAPPVRIPQPTVAPSLAPTGAPPEAVAVAVAPQPAEPESESPFGPYLGPAQVAVPELPGMDSRQASSAERSRRNRTPAIAAGALALVAAVAVIGGWYGGAFDGLFGAPDKEIVNQGGGTGTGTGTENGQGGGTGGGTGTGTENGQGGGTGSGTGTGTENGQGGGTGTGTGTGTENNQGGGTGGGTGTGTENGQGGGTGTGTGTGTENRQGGGTGGDTGTGTENGQGGGTEGGTGTEGGGAGPVDDAAEQVEWLKNYSGGDCFFATAISTNGTKTEIEGFGDSIEAFRDLLNNYIKRFQSEPKIGVRLIRPKQCPITDFLGRMAQGSGNPPDLSLVKYELADRDPMSGEVQMLPDRQTYLLLVDHDGIAHNLDRILKRSGDKATFSIALGLGTGKDDGAIPQVLLAFSTSQPVDAMRMTDAPAAELLPSILDEINSKRIDGTATARYLRIKG